MKKLLLSALAFLFTGVALLQAQQPCGTDEHLKQQLQADPTLHQAHAAFEAAFREAMKSYNPEDYKTNSYGKASAPLYIIPVVVHVLHQYGAENISDAQVKSEISQLNKSFRKLNSDTGNVRPVFKDLAADARVEFRLARKDPQGDLCNGIVRYYSLNTTKGNDELKKKSVWDSKRYFNIWVVNTINRGGGIGVAGYAQFPFFAGGAGSAKTDGIMVIHNEFGNIGTSNPGQTINVTTSSHESGHWLGLYHPFQGDSCDLENDGVDDTPPTFFRPSITEPLRNRCNNPNFNSCVVDNPDLPDQQENIMDYFIGSCASNMFTLGQVARMHFCLNNYRPELWSAENLVRTGTDDATFGTINTAPPIAEFNMHPNAGINTFRTCVSKSVSFRDNSYNSTVSSWAWDFGEGANPATATVQNPSSVIYTTPGYKTVTLTVTGPNGTSTKVRENYIYVEAASESASGSFHTADWDYENNFLAKGWYFENELDFGRWERVTGIAYDGNASLRLNAQTTNYGFSYSLVSPSYNLVDAPNPYITFNYSFAPNLTPLTIGGTNTTGDSQDGLVVYVSTDCGRTWAQRFKVSGNTGNPALLNPMSTLPTSGGTSGIPSSVTFTPSSKDQWKGVTVQGASNISKESNIRFKISFNAAGGNHFYIDNLMIGMSTGIQDITDRELKFTAYPNPFNLATTLSYFMPERAEVKVELFDLLGKHTATLFEGNQEAGKQEIQLDRSQYNLTSGIYFVKLSVNGGGAYSYKLILN